MDLQELYRARLPERERAELEAFDLLRKYDPHVFDYNFDKLLAGALEMGYRSTRPGPGTRHVFYNHIPCFTLRYLKNETYKNLATLAIEKYNKEGEGEWAFEELIYYSIGNGPYDRSYVLYFGARNTSSKDLKPFYAYIVKPHGESEAVECVYSLRKKDVTEYSSEELDDSILRNAKEEDNIGSLGEKACN